MRTLLINLKVVLLAGIIFPHYTSADTTGTAMLGAAPLTLNAKPAAQDEQRASWWRNILPSAGALWGEPSLMDATVRGQLDLMTEILENGTDVDGEDSRGNTSLLLAAGRGLPNEILQTLLDAGADINHTNHSGNTALIRATERRHFTTIQYLIESQADLNIKNTMGYTALLIAARNGFHRETELLINAMANVDLSDNLGYTPLMYASARGDASTVAKLLQAGANPQERSHNGSTAQLLAGIKGHTEVLRLLARPPQVSCRALLNLESGL